MATKEEILKKLGAPASKADILKKLGAPDGKPPEPSPYDSVSGTMTQIGKILGSGLEQAATGIAGMPAQTADMYNAGLGILPEGARPYVEGAARVLNPTLALSQGLRAMGAPTGPEMDQYLRDKGLQYAPEPGSSEDWAQYLTSVAASGAVPIGQPATIANALRGAATSVIPGAVAKAVTDSTESQGAGMGASILASLLQHGGGALAQNLRPTVAAAKIATQDMPANAPATLQEYRDLNLPAMAADVMGPRSQAAVSSRVAAGRPGGSALASELTTRQENAPGRIQGQFEQATGGAPITRKQLETQLEDLRKAEADLQFPTVREGQTPVDIRSFGSQLRAATRGQSTNRPNTLGTLQNKYFDMLARTEEIPAGPGGQTATRITYTSDPSKIYSVVREMEADAKKNPEFAGDIGNLKRQLDGTLEATYPQYAGIKEDFRKASEKIEALNAGADAAKKGRKEDVTNDFSSLGLRKEDPNYVPDPAHKAELEKAFKTGYADTISGKTQNVGIGSTATNAVNSKAMMDELTALYGPELAKKQEFELAANRSTKDIASTVGQPAGIVSRFLSNPVNAALTAGTLPSVFSSHPALAPIGLGAGIANLIRSGAIDKKLIKAAGITNAVDLEKLLKQAQTGKFNMGTNARAAAKAGLVNMITGGQ